MNITLTFDKVYIRPGATDLRKGLYGLLAIINNEMRLDPFEKSLFIFSNKSHKTLKFVVWDKFGFFALQKKCEQGTWPWANTEEEVSELTEEQFDMLLQGIDFWRAPKELKF